MNPPIPFVCAAHYTSGPAWIAALQRAMPDERIVALDALSDAEKADCTVAIVANADPAALRQLPHLSWVHSVWAGVERLMADLRDRPLTIVRLVDPQLADTMAEAVLAWTLYLHRDMPAYAAQQARGEWMTRDYVGPGQRTVGLLGLGALGAAAARRLQDAQFNVCGWSRSRKTLPGVACFAGEAELDTMLSTVDILVCLLPLTAQTTGLLDANRLGRLPQHAQLINFGRGPIVCDAGLREVLDRGWLKHAVLDVFAVEPLPPQEWPWRHPRVTVLPHCSAPTNQTTASAIVAGNIRTYRATGVVPSGVDTVRGY
ncbi:glyoxylate/hydroxypyruvate reductase A [Robbsia sp. Bb-Pol-6]|uniref:Glyoxylate/hydroxypyruvate reductase A n=1 Tax=Robbsia betulipollinis TaxID=2981849 RepID=A0ABT3ZI69_9BURK|nr:glyoxylate/hydroxypyruvate reductase A [Robbsia betulipollinis]